MDQKDLILTKFSLSISIGKLFDGRSSKIRNLLIRRDRFVSVKSGCSAIKNTLIWAKHAKMTPKRPKKLYIWVKSQISMIKLCNFLPVYTKYFFWGYGNMVTLFWGVVCQFTSFRLCCIIAVFTLQSLLRMGYCCHCSRTYVRTYVRTSFQNFFGDFCFLGSSCWLFLTAF